MDRRTITIPAAGEIENHSVSGRTVVFEDVPGFPTAPDVPQINFNGLKPLFPTYEGGQIPYTAKEGISQLRVKGTAESAGSEITFFTVDECLPFKLKGDFQGSYIARYPVAQFNKSIAGGGVVTLSDLEIEDGNGNLPVAMYISAKNFDISYAYKVNPTADIGLPLREDAQEPTKINSLELIQGMRFANKDTGGAADAELNILLEFVG